MKRSVIQLAGRTLLVSLPAKWVDHNSVKKGDELDVLEDGHKLIVNTGKAVSTMETKEINADEMGTLLKKYLFALYKRGVDEIKIRYSNSDMANTVRKIILTETVGYEVVSQTPKSCVVRLITSGSITEFDNLLRRAFLLLLSMGDEALMSLKLKALSHLSQTALLEEPNNRLTTVCRRSLNKWGSETFSKIGPIYYIIEEIENIADEYNFMCNNLYALRDSGKKAEISDEVINILEKVNGIVRLFYEGFYKYDINKFIAIDKTRREIVKDAHDIVENKSPTPAEYYVMHHGITIMERMFDMTGPYLILAN
ncbi:TPA: AbrB/MazE/SpoVT family DNA-binding domain-containing protein [Candidatus Woesearchaeota archaeon]|nr:AbrB/MazE/SpoVT family DNA-binding domain-containing protein [Candidatus Woesearchaeota archaeon]HIH39607.1 AbrB/MazE/SpoVT family DNA-binding domain-containing protein [Candidatus Woesearchaeota archaeon]